FTHRNVVIPPNILSPLFCIPKKQLLRSRPPLAGRDVCRRLGGNALLDGVSPEDRAIVQRRRLCFRFGVEQCGDAGSGSSFGDGRREVSSRNRRDTYCCIANVGQLSRAVAPLAKQLCAGTMRHACGMRTRMAANDVISCVQLTNIRAAQKFRFADVVRGNEEVPPPTALFEQVSGHKRARPAVVKSEQYSVGLRQRVWIVNQPYSGRANRCLDCVKVSSELFDRKLVYVGVVPAKAAAGEMPRRDNVMVEKGDHDTRSLAARFHCRYFVIQGCPQAADFLPLTSIGAAVPW